MPADRVLTTPREAALAHDVLRHLEAPTGRLAVERDDRPAVALPPEVGRVLQQVLTVMARGGTVVVGALPAELTTTTAARLLGVSRPTLMKIRAGEIPAHRVGSHHRLTQEDVLTARRARRERERQALRELMALDDEA